ncbi:MAG: GGDEF domain-containing protein, partial [Thalassolituus sp.]
LDIDHFKRVNDEFGHQAGDEILRCVSGAISEVLPTADSIARYGGEEFSVVLPGINAEQVADIAERIRVGVEALKFDRISAGLKTTISIGYVTGIPTTGDTPDSWLMKADEALYKSKETGRNRVTRGD